MTDRYGFEIQELRDLLQAESSERHELETEVIGLGTKLDNVARDVRELAGRFNTFAQGTFERFDRMMSHLGVPPSKK